MVTTVPATVFVCGTKLLELQKSHFISAWDSFTSCDYTGHFLLSNQPTNQPKKNLNVTNHCSVFKLILVFKVILV